MLIKLNYFNNCNLLSIFYSCYSHIKKKIMRRITMFINSSGKSFCSILTYMRFQVLWTTWMSEKEFGNINAGLSITQ